MFRNQVRGGSAQRATPTALRPARITLITPRAHHICALAARPRRAPAPHASLPPDPLAFPLTRAV